MHREQRKTRSPLEVKPLRYAGQSMDEEIDRIFYDEVMQWLTFSCVVGSLAGMEWYSWFFSFPRQPYVYTVIALLVVAYTARKIVQTRRKIEPLKLGRDGERIMGEYLDRLRKNGCQVFHDLVGAGFNVDHVVVGPHGIFTVETKTISKPVGKSGKVRYEGGKLTVNGFAPDRDPIVQAKAQGKWVGSLIESGTGRRFPVKPVVVFHGWFVEPVRDAPQSDVWVLNPKALQSFVEHEPNVMKPEDVALAARAIDCYIRDAQGAQ